MFCAACLSLRVSPPSVSCKSAAMSVSVSMKCRELLHLDDQKDSSDQMLCGDHTRAKHSKTHRATNTAVAAESKHINTRVRSASTRNTKTQC